MGETMKALMYLERGKLELREIQIPVCGEDDIIIAVKAAGIRGADLHWESGAFGAVLPLGEYKTGYQMMRSQQVAKAVLLPEQEECR